jgi:hypothetical protein
MDWGDGMATQKAQCKDALQSQRREEVPGLAQQLQAVDVQPVRIQHHATERD